MNRCHVIIGLDVQVRILRDYGISTGVKNENVWHRRDIHVDQNRFHIRMNLWNDQVIVRESYIVFYNFKFIYRLG